MRDIKELQKNNIEKLLSGASVCIYGGDIQQRYVFLYCKNI